MGSVQEQPAEWGGVRIFSETAGQRKGEDAHQGVYAYKDGGIQAAVAKFFGRAMEVSLGGKVYTVNKESAKHFFGLAKDASDVQIRSNLLDQVVKARRKENVQQLKEFFKVCLPIAAVYASSMQKLSDISKVREAYNKLNDDQKVRLNEILNQPWDDKIEIPGFFTPDLDRLRSLIRWEM